LLCIKQDHLPLPTLLLLLLLLLLKTQIQEHLIA
jgi:hypothetical protein